MPRQIRAATSQPDKLALSIRELATQAATLLPHKLALSIRELVTQAVTLQLDKPALSSIRELVIRVATVLLAN